MTAVSSQGVPAPEDKDHRLDRLGQARRSTKTREANFDDYLLRPLGDEALLKY